MFDKSLVVSRSDFAQCWCGCFRFSYSLWSTTQLL